VLAEDRSWQAERSAAIEDGERQWAQLKTAFEVQSRVRGREWSSAKSLIEHVLERVPRG
jgi:hypothetical protein